LAPSPSQTVSESGTGWTLKRLDAMIEMARDNLNLARRARDEGLVHVYRLVEDGMPPDEALNGLAVIDNGILLTLRSLHQFNALREQQRVFELEHADTRQITPIGK
jgi:hypothetical protein